MDVQIKEVVSLKDLRLFIRFPNTLYRGNPNYVPSLVIDELNTLRRDKNPAFAHCEAKYWLAYRKGQLVGRIAGIINRLHIEKWGQSYARFGWIDFINDAAVSEALLNAVESWAKQKDMTAIHGPLGFTDLDPEGMLVDGFDEPGTMVTIYNYPYYRLHLEKQGYNKDIDWVEYEIRVPSEPNETISRVANIALRRNKLKLLGVRNKKDLLPYAAELFQILDEAYEHLYGYVPLTPKQAQMYTKEYFGYLSPDFIPVILDENNRMVAFGITMPSLTRAMQKAKGKLFPFGLIHLMRALKKNDRADLYLVAVRPEYQGKGVNAILINQMNNVYNRLGIARVESNPELETNHLVQDQWKYFDKRQHKRRRCYIKRLSESS